MESTDPTAARSPEQVARQITQLRRTIARDILGQDNLIEDLIVAALAQGHVLIEGAPGLGKTRLVRAFAAATDLSFGRIQFTPDLMPADITGSSVYLEHEARFEFRPGPVFTHVLLADEINRATPKTQSALLEAMQEQAVTASGESLPLPNPFLVLATQNPIEMEGTYPLPEAQLDRFLFKLQVPRPDTQTLVTILEATTGVSEDDAGPVVTRSELQALQDRLRAVPIARAGLEYAARLVEGSHTLEHVRLGASPRGAQALVLAAKGYAMVAGRPHVDFEDIQRAVHPALRHRILPTFEAEVEGTSIDQLLDSLIERTPQVVG